MVFKHSPGGMAITETWYHPGVLDSEIHLSIYILLFRDRSDPVMVMVLYSLSGRDLIQSLRSHNLYLPNDWYQIGNSSSSLTDCCVFRTHSSMHKKGPHDLSQYLASLPGRLLLRGDFYATLPTLCRTVMMLHPHSMRHCSRLSNLIFQHVLTRARLDADQSLMALIIISEPNDMKSLEQIMQSSSPEYLAPERQGPTCLLKRLLQSRYRSFARSRLGFELGY